MNSFSQHLFSLIIVFSSSFFLNTAAKSPPPPSNDSTFIISCGSSTTSTDSYGRQWLPDSNYLITPSADNKNTSTTALQQDPSLPLTPYMSARVFTSPSTYQFPISPQNRHYLRLHFYPSAYSDGRNPDDAYFSVVANNFTLLNNFSAALTAEALTQAYFIKEYSLVPSQSGKLNITFSPSNQHAGSYAFVNGIEIIPMPEMFEQAAPLVSTSESIDVRNYSLQTMLRLNVGGQFIAPDKDSGGLSRTWYDDTPYLYGAAFGVTESADKNVTIRNPNDFPEYIAPENVLATARSMGPNNTVNVNFNLSWVLRVDAGFTYVVRLYFCELYYTKINQRAFDIYVNNQIAQDGADVIGWTGSIGVPVCKDYATFVMDVPGDDEELFVGLHPAVKSRPQYYNAILNGLEVFKISDNHGNLAGPNPSPSQMLLDNEAGKGKRFSHSKHILAKALGGAAGAVLILFVVVCFSVYLIKKRASSGNDFVVIGNWLSIHDSSSQTSSTTESGCGSNISSLTQQGLCRHFSLAEIRHATKNFDESQVIGVGGFGKVYKGVIDAGTEVAVKRSNPSSQQGVMEFQTEIDMLSKLRHRHLVSLIGFCEEDGEMILVYDYMANGTLREHLYKSGKPALSWKQRLEICIGAARGLHYLHTGAKYTIIHRDVKTTNILLDKSWVAKVSDFGLSKSGTNLNQTHVSTMVKGSFGYLDPEYFRRQQLTEKSDVYSFGVVLFEVLCARPVLDPNLPKEQVSLADWALTNLEQGTLEDIVDPHLQGKINPECLRKFTEIAHKCLADNGLERPSMGDVLWKLEFALQLQENMYGGKRAAKEKANDAYASHNATLDIVAEGIIGGELDDSSSGAIFSQVANPTPKGR